MTSDTDSARHQALAAVGAIGLVSSLFIYLGAIRGETHCMEGDWRDSDIQYDVSNGQ